jgi:hypothetical protein
VGEGEGEEGGEYLDFFAYRVHIRVYEWGGYIAISLGCGLKHLFVEILNKTVYLEHFKAKCRQYPTLVELMFMVHLRRLDNGG